MAGADFQQLLDKAERLLDRIRTKANELVESLNNLLSKIPSLLVPGWVVESIQTGIRKMYEVYDQLVTKMQEFFESPGWPWALYDAGDRWLNEVGSAAADTEERINADRLKVDDYWKGSAAQSYTNTLGTQQAAFAAMVGVARKVKESLHQAGRGIRNFWIAIAIGLTTAAVGIVAAIIEVTGVLTAPAAPPTATIAIVAAISTILAGYWAVFQEFEGIKIEVEALREEARYNPDFDGDRWPRATAAGEWQAD
ncbi:MAG: hypothetical protein GEU83_06635 [Pseudonocardiaceae bacterium]|nr:hypothetical protein [Pseudonocardiaceae bacterium]